MKNTMPPRQPIPPNKKQAMFCVLNQCYIGIICIYQLTDRHQRCALFHTERVFTNVWFVCAIR